MGCRLVIFGRGQEYIKVDRLDDFARRDAREKQRADPKKI
jgi:hypothetical protein